MENVIVKPETKPRIIPWNELIRLARQGEPEAVRCFYAETQPFVDRLCRIPYFADRLGADEISGITALKLTEFLKSDTAVPESDREVPFLLKRILRFHLINAINKSLLRSKYEISESMLIPSSGEATDCCASLLEKLEADASANPETACLQAEAYDELLQLIQRLPKNEQAVLRGLYVDEKTPEEVAEDLHYSPRGLRNVRKKALDRLREEIMKLRKAWIGEKHGHKTER